ncbi:MAG: sulfatase-like hydrolase/transferase [Ginsengibacter sp.]
MVKFLLKKINCVFIITISLVVLNGCKKNTNSIPVNHLVNKPNIILLLADDYGYEIPTCDGGQSYETPNIDLMAQNGMRFTQCHATPLCSPSRVELMTGKYNFRNYTDWGLLGLEQRTFANMLSDAGYATCIAGKWQLDGGNEAIHTFGFNVYSVFEAFSHDDRARYKSPRIYQDGNYLPDSFTNSKYADDIFTDYILNFIQTNHSKKTPFFVYYPLSLTHSPFSPTPDDPEFAGWDPNSPSAPQFFPSMVKYMDKKIGQIVAEIKNLGIEDSTIILFSGDNGTAQEITSKFNGMRIKGGKGLTTEAGTHVPLIAYAPGFVSSSVNNDLIDFTDFLLTLAGIANIPIPVNYGVLDGVSFYPGLIGEAGTPRDWIFCHFDPHPGQDTLERYVQNINYKYYEDGRFYNIVSDILELNPIPDALLSPDEEKIKQGFKDVLSQLH